MKESQETFPVLPLRDIVVFPNMIVPLFVGRRKSVLALEQVVNEEKGLLLAAQTDPKHDEPEVDQVFKVGVLANVLQLLKLPDSTVKVLVEGHTRVKIDEFVKTDSYFEVLASELPYEVGDPAETLALMKSNKEAFETYAKGKRSIPDEAIAEVMETDDPARLSDMLAGHLSVTVPQKQEILELSNLVTRLEKIFALLQAEMSVMKVEKKIKSRVKSQMERTQREYYLNEQMKAIQRELGDNEERSELDELAQKIEKTEFSDEARDKAKAELKKLRSMGPNSSEATVVRNYLDWLLSIPWGTKKEVTEDISFAEKVLDEDHYGLEKVKERIVEYIAVQKRTKKISGPILCLVGPPGVGKTSLGQSAARATGREFVRVSLGGVRDEAEIRGHRRTYIGSMPGRIIQSLRRGESVNPLILLDEIDKLGHSYRGDPASAMLEVLDPEQNSKFVDHYLDVDYDLSDVMFITTANYLHNIPEPLLDRMEIISLPGYTEDEKLEIAKRHLVPKQRTSHGIKPGEFRISQTALESIIRTYTREAGVRNMEREIAKLIRKTVTRLEKEDVSKISVTGKNVGDFLGVPPYRYGLAEKTNQVGVATGLAWTHTGGDLLSIEAAVLPGKGRMKATGKLGDVMKESIDAAATFVRSISPEIGIRQKEFEKIDIHVHVPEGATPKEGPSAGVGMVTSIVSVLTRIPVRRDVAMTGEITLRGTVLPIGGLKSKLLAAIRGGIKTVLIPEKNKKDLADIPESITNKVTIETVSNVKDVLAKALTRMPEAIDPDLEDAKVIPPAAIVQPGETASVAKH